MTGKRGKSGGAHYCKSADEKKDVNFHLRLTAKQYRRLQVITAALFGDPNHRLSKTVGQLIKDGYEMYVIQNGSIPYSEFKLDFRELWQPELYHKSPCYYLSAGFVKRIYLTATSVFSRDVSEMVIEEICRQFPADVQEIISYYRVRANIDYHPAEVVEYAIRFVQESHISLPQFPTEGMVHG